MPPVAQGHGTHVTGITAGTTFGVAKRATIHAVKTMGDDGSGSYSNIIAGGGPWLAQGREGGAPHCCTPTSLPKPTLQA